MATRQSAWDIEIGRRIVDIDLGNWIIDRILLEEVDNFLALGIFESEADAIDILARLDESRQRGHFGDARRAPGGTKVDHHPLPAMTGKIKCLAVDGFDLQHGFRCGFGVERNREHGDHGAEHQKGS